MLEVYSYQNPYGSIGLIDQQGLSGYYSGNMSEAEVTLVNAFMLSRDLSPLNTRVMKEGPDSYVILIASIRQEESSHPYQQATIKLRYGDFSRYLQKVNENLMACKTFAANDNQKNMISAYIQHFQSGDMEQHRESQKHWISDKAPIIETNLGFIEHYLDPTKVRAEWEGFVAIVDKDKSGILG